MTMQTGAAAGAANKSAPALDGLAALVVKEGVALGGLNEDTRQQVLGLVWAGLPAEPTAEPAVNVALKQQLAGAARCLATDHVELRRWLCDAGWLRRDGWGRVYSRARRDELPAAREVLAAALAQAFGDAGPAAWVEQLCAERRAARQARRQAHEATRNPATAGAAP